MIANPVFAEDAPEHAQTDTINPAGGKQNLDIAVAEKAAAGTFSLEQEDIWKAEIGLIHDISNIKSDTKLQTAFRVLYGASKFGTYIGIEKGSHMEKFVLSEGIKVNGGKVQVTAALLRRLVEVYFSDLSLTERPTMTQKAIGLDYTMGFDRASILRELTASVAYFDVDDKDLGTLGHIIIDTDTTFDQTRIDGGIRGGRKLLAEFTATLRIAAKVRADITAGLENFKYNAMYDKDASRATAGAGGLKLSWQPNSYNNITLSADKTKEQQNSRLKYTHDFGNNFRAFAEGSHSDNKKGIEDENKALLGIEYAFGNSKKSKLPELFADYHDNKTLKLGDLTPSSRVATGEIQVKEQVTYKKHEVSINKTALGGTSYLEKNPDGTLKSVNLDTGATNLVSVASVNYAAQAAWFSVKSGRYLSIANFEKLNAPATYRVSILDGSGTYTVISFATVVGSVGLNLAPEIASQVSKDLADAFVAGTKSLADISAAAAATAADTVPNAFAFVDQTGVALSSLIVSAPITVNGINSAAAISIAGGEYRVNGGAWTAAAGTVNNGDTVEARRTSSAALSTATDTTVTIGGVSDVFTNTTLGADTTPDAFAFVDQTGVARSTVIGSAPVTIGGINSPAAISVAGGEYRVNGGTWTATVGTVNNGDTVEARHTSSASFSAATDTTVTIGGVADIFTSATLSADTVPDAYAFTDQSGVVADTWVISNSITVSGINTAATISLSSNGDGYYSINLTGWAVAGTVWTVNNGDTVRIRNRSSAISGQTVDSTLNIGGVTDTFSTTTQ